MKKIMSFIKCVGFLAGLALILGVCDYCFAPSGYVRFILHEMNKKETNYDTLVLGASHARSAISPDFIDEQLGTNTLNIAVPGATVDDSYYMLKDACDSNDVKTVIIDVDYQYWVEAQPTAYFTEAFICRNITDLDVKLEYYWDKIDSIDIRNVVTRRLSWDCSPKSVKRNLKVKRTQSYKNYQIEAAGVDGKVEGADGPYMGKGFFYRITFGGKPGGADYINLWIERQYAGIDPNVREQFQRIIDYCNKKNIKIICVTSPIAPSAMKTLGMERVHNTLKTAFDEWGVEYYDFNLALMSVVPRDDIDYGDLEGHMGGELAQEYSAVLGKLLKDAQDGELDRSQYFYSSFEEMYGTMKTDYTKATGNAWEGY